MNTIGSSASVGSLPGASATHSRYVQRIRRRYASELALLSHLPLSCGAIPRANDVHAVVNTLLAQGQSLASSLRIARHLVLERLAVLDIEHGTAMQDITLAMTELAETTRCNTHAYG
jgi:[glutamine synthetase] adenylyltransferase / [glutamine synthetase]-adenylyl-L-tyrosine phosphorylase